MTEKEKDELIERLQKENAELKAEIIELKARIEALERLLNMNSRNSSKPPSSDPPNMSKESHKKKSKKRGAKNGHELHLKKMLPPDQVTQSYVIEPQECPCCGHEDFIESRKDPLRDQFIDIPPIQPEVIEYVRPVRLCINCGTEIFAPYPEEAPRTCFGAGVLSLIAILTGVLNVSKRKALMVMNEVFNVPISLGGLSNCEEQISSSLIAPYNEIKDHIHKEDSANADETSWKLNNKTKGWLWLLCCKTAALFIVQARRTQQMAKNLLGCFKGVLTTDRYGSYNFFKGVRQICFAHLSRDFKAMSEASGHMGEIGTQLKNLSTEILKLRKKVRGGKLQWENFQKRMPPLIERVEDLLEEGAQHEGALAGKCREIFKMKNHLWTFVYREDVDPTNNHAERIIRSAVLWRKSSFGTQSERGARYVERVLSVAATCKLQGRSVIDFVRQACKSHTQKLCAPSLI
jgi:transposase